MKLKIAGIGGAWLLTRTVLLLGLCKVWTLPGSDVTLDVQFIYQGWYEVLRTGTFPVADVTWQYPPAAALAVLSPGLLPFLGYAPAFFALSCLTDAVVCAALVYTGLRAGRSGAGAWLWVAGLPLLGPIVYARYDLMVTAVAVAALLVAARLPRAAGALAGFGALLKVWPVLLLIGVPRGPRTRATWGAAVVTALGATLLAAAAMPGALSFLTSQRDRGTEVESLGALVFHAARHFGWGGHVRYTYGSVEFIGPYVPLVSRIALALTVSACCGLLLWRLRARRFAVRTPFDAAFAAVLLFTTTSRVISPQYLVWLIGLAAVCLTTRTTRQRLPALLVLLAAPLTQLEFPVWFRHVSHSDWQGVVPLALRNGLLVAATVIACVRLWRETVSEPRAAATAARPDERVPATLSS
ncbi:glycosyltransferase 87 family protein [Streptomyces sp. NPDC050617]|uniref:glycosyltransferase 87 family protein n=1 Tax=Streptomyces sp. NPDC050617 TaxID=3154628 RepID=UPI003440D3CB